MNQNKFNKKLVNNLILGSFLFGTSAGIITQVQGTQQLPNGRQSIHKYDKEATKQLKELLAKPETPLEECIKLVQSNNADPNIRVGLFTLLEEMVLRRHSRVKILVDKGANIYGITNKQIVKDEHGKETIYGRTLLHLAVYPPQKVRGLLYQHKWKKIYDWMKEKSKKHKNPIPLARQEAPAPEIARREAAEKELHTLKINEYIGRINSWGILEHLPSKAAIEVLLENGLGSDEINMKEMPDSNSSPYDIILADYEEISEKKSPFHKAIKEKNYFPIKALLEEKLCEEKLRR